MRILSIGNSFSRDAHRYLHAIAQSAGKELETVNLYIGGCPLERHWANIERDEAAYGEDRNGEETGRTLSVAQALREGPWDAVTLQQASHDSGWKDTYEPFLTQILAFLRENAPGVPVWMHQTWAYEDDSTHAAFARYHRNRAEMARRSQEAYRYFAALHGLPLIPSGEMIERLRATPAFGPGGTKITRDGFHMSLDLGRFAVGCLFAARLAGADMEKVTFAPEGTDEEMLALIRNTVAEVCRNE